MDERCVMDLEQNQPPVEEIGSENYQYVEQYAREKQLRNTLQVLPLVRRLVFHTGGLVDSPFGEAAAQLCHCLNICRVLIDLHVPVSNREEDALLAAALCHILPEGCQMDGVEPDVLQILKLIRREDFLDMEKRLLFIRRVQGNRLAMLIRIADQGDFVEQIHKFSGWRTRQYIYETRNIYLPMCIYAKEHYPELLAPVSILMEKMRCMIEVAEILQDRYELRETELTKEIFSLREENARIKESIRILKGNE